MRQFFQKLRHAVRNNQERHTVRTTGMVIGMILSGWIIGSFMVGALESPSRLGATMTETTGVVPHQSPHAQETQGFSAIVKSVRPAIVNITASKEMKTPLSGTPFDSIPDFWRREFFGLPDGPRGSQGPDGPNGTGMGSGVIISPDGYVVTNHHVVEEAKDVTVTLPDKRVFSGKLVGTDPKTDLAVVKIDAENLPHLVWGNSSHLQVGDYLLAVGNPFGLNSTVTQGIVSALGRGGMGITQYEDFIQTDAAINPGNSGGALINMQGELVGINTAILSRTGGYQGVGFAIPTTMAQPVYESLVKDGKVVRGYLGVDIQEVTPDLAKSLDLTEPSGSLVTNVQKGSPADQAGITRGDTIVKYQDSSIADPRALQRAVTHTPVGSTVTITVVRKGTERVLATTIVEYPDKRQLAKADDSLEESALAGVMVDSLNQRLARRLGHDDETEGVIVRHVESGSQANHAGLAQGDVISEINRNPVGSVDDYKYIVSKLKDDQLVLLLIHRSEVPLFLTVKI